MNDDRIEDLLDLWEELIESGKTSTLDEFVAEYCRDDPTETVARFRQRARTLEAVDAALGVGPSHTEPVLDLREGTEPIQGYQLVSRLGSGSFGEVWTAKAPGGFHVALKFIPCSSESARVEQRSLKVIQSVRHPHLLSLFGAWNQNGYLIIASELAEATLLDRFRSAVDDGLDGIPGAELLDYIADAASGIDHLNQTSAGTHGIQHRDIKPANLFLSGGRVKVGDFGIARPLTSAMDDQTGRMTMSFAPPEAYGQKLATTSDQYSLALTYVFLLTGRMPFSGSPIQVMARKQDGSVELSFVPSDERSILMRALSPDPTARFESCTSFVDALKSRSHSAITSNGETGYNHTSRRKRIGKSVLLLFVLAALVLAGIEVFRSDVAPPMNRVEGDGAQSADSPELQVSSPNAKFHDLPADASIADVLAAWPQAISATLDSEAEYDDASNELVLPVRLEVDRPRFNEWTHRVIRHAAVTQISDRNLILHGEQATNHLGKPISNWMHVKDAAALFGPPVSTSAKTNVVIWLCSESNSGNRTLNWRSCEAAVSVEELRPLIETIQLRVIVNNAEKRVLIADQFEVEQESWHNVFGPREPTDSLPFVVDTVLRTHDGKSAGNQPIGLKSYFEKAQVGDSGIVNVLIAPFTHKLWRGSLGNRLYYSASRQMEIRVAADRSVFDRMATVEMTLEYAN